MKIFVTLCKKLLIILFLTGSTVASSDFRHYNEWTNKERLAWTTGATLAYVDVMQTREALVHPCGCYKEGNPIYGNDPHIDRIIAVNVLAQSLIYYAIGINQPDSPNLIRGMWASNALRISVIANSDRVGIDWRVAF